MFSKKLSVAVASVVGVVALCSLAFQSHSTATASVQEVRLQYSPVERLIEVNDVLAATTASDLKSQGVKSSDIANGVLAEVYDQVENTHEGKHTILHRTVFVPSAMVAQVKEGQLIAFNRLSDFPVANLVVEAKDHAEAYACIKAPSLMGISSCVEHSFKQ